MFAFVPALVVTLGVVSARLFVWPAEGMPPGASAIVMLAGRAIACRWRCNWPASTGPRCSSFAGLAGVRGPCPAPVPGVRLICFDPDPGNTRGEAEFVGRLATRYHWRSMVLATTREQDTRARIRMGRCLGGRATRSPRRCR